MKTRLRFSKRKGFALVATLSMMILLTLIAVGLLTLSTVTVRASGRDDAMATARANARLALMIAIGELQKSMGRDQAVSAPASAVITEAPQPHLTGAWEGWRWTPTTSGAPPYSEKRSKFSRWLVSTADPQAAEQFDFPTRAAATGSASVKLVGQYKTSQNVATEVYAEKVNVGDTAKPGKMAWAVFDESTKASIQLGELATAQTPGEEVGSRNAPYRMRADVTDPKLAALKTPEKLISLETAVLPVGVENANEIHRRFHDFTTNSVGLLTDTANGGLKKDLTSLFEEATLPADAFPRDTPYEAAFTTANGAPSWEYFHNHYRKYKAVKTSSKVPSYTLTKTDDLKIENKSGDPLFGVQPSPKTERLLPVIAKFQMVFSLISHSPFNVDTRRSSLAAVDPTYTHANGPGYLRYGVIHLAYDPVVTLYNPYDVTLDLEKTRIRVWDPPIVFQFTKYDKQNGSVSTFRSDGVFAGLPQFQIAEARNFNARRCFTLVLADGSATTLSGKLQLKPGEVKVFSPRIDPGWNWAKETAGGWGMKGAFFDWDKGRNFGNRDSRTSATQGNFGVECIPGWNVQAGLQADHLADPRSPTSRYTYEGNAGFVTMRLSDDIEVEAKPQVTSGGTSNASYQFQVDVLAGSTFATSSGSNVTKATETEEAADTLRSYRFSFINPDQELNPTPGTVIKRKYNVYDTFQSDADTTQGKKKPFAMLELSARTTKQKETDTKPWLYNNPVVEGSIQKSDEIGLAMQSYDLRFIEMSSFNSFPGGIEIDPDTYRGYFGASGSAFEGSSFVNMLHVPLAPASSLGDLIPANLVASALPPRVVHPLGNSRAHPLIGTGKVAHNALMDHSYLLNDALWDGYFFSSLTDYDTELFAPTRDRKTVMTDLLDGKKPALNTRLIAATTAGDAATEAEKLMGLTPTQRSKQIAKNVAISGPFNVNSTSVDAWRAALASLRDRTINGLAVDKTSINPTTYGSANKTPVARSGKPMGDDEAATELRWAAFRTLTDAQIESLAKSIVAEISKRGKADGAPSMTLAEFVNRRPGSDVHSSAGLLQTAIDQSDINKSAHEMDSKDLPTISRFRSKGIQDAKLLQGKSAEGAPTIISQGDLMAGLASIATVRGDTFKIRAYGESLSQDGKTVLARAWCEAVVQRTPEFVDPANSAETETTALNQTNQNFGRRFQIVSFKQLSEDEI